MIDERPHRRDSPRRVADAVARVVGADKLPFDLAQLVGRAQTRQDGEIDDGSVGAVVLFLASEMAQFVNRGSA